jgi:hypothetical protein
MPPAKKKASSPQGAPSQSISKPAAPATEPHSAPSVTGGRGPVSRDASAQGGRAKTLAKRQALADVQQLRREAAAARVRALHVPPAFASVGDFLERLQTLVQARAGANADLARHCGVSTSTASKWLARKMIPTQANLDKLIEWWGRHHSADAPKAGQSVPAAIAPRPQELSLGRLPQDIAARLRRTARQRNLKPLAYLVQILDRQLPTAAELDLR